ncbi:hypothetical protein Tco_0952490 [Tanacetum coccineum]|uniref:Uncharacterized protein n=1 Tax=Tanacetum coccineum TaxID=301880 RepID=A0ABQ5DX40_9ASTR
MAVISIHASVSIMCCQMASAMPFVDLMCLKSRALVTDVVVVFMAGDALVVLFFGAISFKSPSNKTKLV